MGEGRGVKARDGVYMVETISDLVSEWVDMCIGSLHASRVGSAFN